MSLILVLYLWLLPSAVLYVYGNPAVVVTISPSIWDLIETKADVITKSVTSIRIPDQEHRVSVFVGRAYDVEITDFRVDKSDVYFVHMDDGIHIRAEEVKFEFSVDIHIGVPFDFNWWIFSHEGDLWSYDRKVYFSSTDAAFDVIMTWDENQFEFIPAVVVNSNLEMDAGYRPEDHEIGNKILSYIERRLREELDKLLSEKLNSLISDHLNPQMWKLRKQLSMLGFRNYNFKWMVEDSALRLIIGDDSESDKLLRKASSDYMMCAHLNIPATENLRKFFKPRRKRDLVLDLNKPYGIEISCIDQDFSFNRKRGSKWCMDFDYNFSRDNKDKVVGCEPDLPFNNYFT